jgi:hypothetical protein
MVRSGGSHGLLMEVPARAEGQVCLEDGQYQFRAHLIRDGGHLVFVLRCPEANYFQEFVYDPQNPTWAAGYIHQALSEYVAGFVRWRLGGGEVSWGERAGIPEVITDPPSPLLVSFIRERVNRNLVFNQGPSEDWWPLGSGAEEHWRGGAVARTGAGSGEPMMRKIGGKMRLTTRDELHIRREALRELHLPGTVLVWLCATHLLAGTGWFANGIYSWLAEDKLGDVGFAIKVSFSMGLLAYGLGTAALLGGRRYKRMSEHKLVMLCLCFTGLMPLLYLGLSLWMSWWMALSSPLWLGGGLGVSIWAWRIWTRPMIQQARQLENPSG